MNDRDTSPFQPLPGDTPVAPPPPARGRWRGGIIALLIALALLVGALGGGAAGAALMMMTLAPQATAAPPIVADTTPRVQPVVAATPAADPSSLTEIYNQVGAAVVSIRTSGGPNQSGTGSGFIVDGNGDIITNNHVVQSGGTLVVTLKDGTDLPARVIGTAPGHDLALIKVDPPSQGLSVAQLGDSDAVVPGETAIAIGSPFGLEQTITSGIVSSTGRTFSGAGRPLRGLIQTDAAINPGNSGGPLLNSHGEVIGITTLKAPESQGIGFAVPVNTAKRLLPQLKAGGRISAPYLGIRGREITPLLAKSLGLPVDKGVLIVDTVEGGPAAAAGIQGSSVSQGDTAGRGGDVVTAIDGTPVQRVEDISSILDTKKAGETVMVTVVRNDQTLAIPVVLAEWPES